MNHSLRRILPPLSLLLATALAPETYARGSLVGRPLPALELSHSVQGEAWSRDDLLGSVVVLDLFQIG